MGLLVKQGLVQSEAFIEMYWHTIILSWSDLSKEIREMQAKNPAYMKNFEDLYRQLNEYRQLHYKDLKLI